MSDRLVVAQRRRRSWADRVAACAAPNIAASDVGHTAITVEDALAELAGAEIARAEKREATR